MTPAHEGGVGGVPGGGRTSNSLAVPGKGRSVLIGWPAAEV
jgi:hypothetical protein